MEDKNKPKDPFRKFVNPGDEISEDGEVSLTEIISILAIRSLRQESQIDELKKELNEVKERIK